MVAESIGSMATAAPVSWIAPSNLVSSDQIFGSGTLASDSHVQEIYGAAHFPGGGLYITELRFRPDYFYGKAFTSTVANITIRLSTSTQVPDGLSTDFAQNAGEDETEVFSGSITLSSQFVGPPSGPKEFDIAIPLTTPFTYAPAYGNLLIDIRNFSGSDASLLSGQFSYGDSASRLVGGIGSSLGSPDTGIDALEIVYVPTNMPPPPPPRLTRGPYLQRGTMTNMLVRWRSNRATDSLVRFGLAPDTFTWEILDSTAVTEHIVTITNLTPGTKYYYQVGTTETNLANATNGWFFTAPANPKPVRIWALGDSGTANQPGYLGMAAQVRDAYYAFTGDRPTDVWLMLGDNAYLSGTDQQYQDAVFSVYPVALRTTPLWPTIGNHDVTFAGGSYAYLNVFSPPMEGEAGGVASGSKHYYSFDFSNVHFVCLDSEDSDRTPFGPMLTWLEQDLAANTNDWLIAFWHCPPYTFGSHNSDSAFDTGGHMLQMRENAVPIIEDYGVDLVLSGHSHNYERSYLLDGHYGLHDTLTPAMVKDSGSGHPNEHGTYDETGAYRKPSLGPAPHEGAVYAVCGSSGWVTPDTIIPVYQHPAMFIKLKQLGSVVVDINSNRLDAIFLRESGAIDDHFTIIKGVGAEPTRIATFRVNAGIAQAQFKSEAGHTYRLQRTASLENPDWQNASGDLVAAGATTGWTNSVPETDTRAFYRVVRLD